MTTTARIFLAHAKEDKATIRQIYDQLEARGFSPWLDEVDLLPGQIWKDEIQKQIESAAVFLAFLSKKSVRKVGYVQNEFRMALEVFGNFPPGHIYFIPIRLDQCKIPDLRNPKNGHSLNDFHWVDLFKSDGFEQLERAIKVALESGNLASEADEDEPDSNPGGDITGELIAKEFISSEAVININNQKKLIDFNSKQKILNLRSLINVLYHIEKLGNKKRLLIWVMDIGNRDFEQTDDRLRYLNVNSLAVRFKALKMFRDEDASQKIDGNG